MKESWKVFVIQKVWVRFDLPPLCIGAASDLPQLVPTRCGNCGKRSNSPFSLTLLVTL